MQVLSKEKSKVLAERHGWPLTVAEGFVDGEAFRKRGRTPPPHALVGMDEYSEGFRAGYYARPPVSGRNGAGHFPFPTSRLPGKEEISS
jgi:hypothetical protein